MKPIFEPSDFQEIYKNIFREGYKSYGAGDMWEPEYRVEDVVATANAKINKLIESWPVVYGNEIGGHWSITKTSYDTHKARLAFIEELPKEPCKHEPKYCLTEYNIILPLKCIHCGIELVAEWKPRNTSEGL